jgi:acyl-CoA oxidase
MWKNIQVKKTVSKSTQPLFGYLHEADTLQTAKSDIKTIEDALCPNRLEQALKIRALYRIKKTMDLLQKAEKDGVSENERVNSLYSTDIVAMAQSHIMYVTFKIFRSAVEDQSKIKCNGVRKNLQLLLKVFALSELLGADGATLYEAGFFQSGVAQILVDANKKLMKYLRPQMIPLIESWGIPDEILVSAIGNKYGDIYETQLEWARNSKLNKSPMVKGFKEYFLPIIAGKL